MKKLSKFGLVTLLIFLFVFAGSLVIVKPVFNRLEQSVTSLTEKLSDQIYDISGLRFSFEAFSPSILSSFKIKNINLKDEQDFSVAKVKSIRVRYRLQDLLSGKIDDFIRSVAIDGIELDAGKLVEVISKIQFPQTDDNTVDINQIMQFIPSDISVKNVHVVYKDENLDADALLKSVSVVNPKRNECIELQLKSSASVYVAQAGMTFSGSLGASGTIYNNLENSSLNLKLSDWTNGTYRLSRINLLATYRNKKIEAHTIQSTTPFYAGAQVDLNTMQVSGEVKTENLNVLSLVTDVSGKNSLSFLKSIRPTVNADFTFDPSQAAINYKSAGKIFVGDALFPGAVNVYYDLSGDDKKIKVKSLSAKGQNISLNSRLSFVFNTFQLDGFINLADYSLPNGNSISSEILIDPLLKGFTLFTPQVHIGNKNLTALQASIIPTRDSFDFALEVSDYNTNTDAKAGLVKIDGSLLTNSSYAQASISMDSLSVGSILEYVQQVVPKENVADLDGVRNFANPYLFSGDVYFSSDFKSVSYNVPYLIVANTENESQYLFASANGNEQSVQINRFDFIFGKYALNLQASFELNPETSDGFFMVDLLFSQIPYHFSGSIMQDLINITGDYGVNAEIRLGKKNNVRGEFYIDSLPIIFDKINLCLSMDSAFTFDPDEGPDIKVSRLEIKENKKGTADEPKLLLTGSGNKYKASIDSIAYTDEISALYGNAGVTYNFTQEIFNNAALNLNIYNPLSDEEINLTASLSNPDGKEFSAGDILDSLYLNTNLDIRHFSLNRFLSVQNEDNEISSTISVTGPLSHPYAMIELSKASMHFGNDIISASGALFLEDRVLSLESLKVKYGTAVIDNFTGSIATDTFDGKFSAIVAAAGFVIPLSINVYDAYIPEGSFAPETFMIKLSSDKIKGDMLKKKVGFDITAAYTKDIISIFSSDNLGLVGTFLPSSGEVYGSINSEDIVSLNLDGKINQDSVNIKISNINANLPRILSYFDVDKFVIMESGLLKGSLVMGGSFDTPDFRGALSITSPKVTLPTVFQSSLSTDKILIAAANNEITLREDEYSIDKTPRFKMGAKIFLDKWIVDSVEATVQTLKGQIIPLKLKTDFVNVSGELSADLNINYSDFLWDIDGSVFGDKLNIVSNLSDITSAASSMSASEKQNPKMAPANEMYVRTDLDVILGTHVMLNFNPLLRCIFAPNTKVGINVDTQTGIYDITGGLSIKSGDISYLNRSFYIKEGSIQFNSDNLANPLVSLRAETKEKDDKGKNVTIVLSAENQYLLDFTPKFTAIPAKSETEILELLGEIVVADSDNASDLLFASADYAFQSTVVRGVENKLRDFMNFDIFSIRTNVIQNALTLGTSGELSKDDITLGNFLDNSTVYIGKYLGSSLYVDATFNFSLENGQVTDPTKANGLLFQPQFGLELELPIANIRWNMTPDIKALMSGQYVPANSLSLSWSYQF